MNKTTIAVSDASAEIICQSPEFEKGIGSIKLVVSMPDLQRLTFYFFKEPRKKISFAKRITAEEKAIVKKYYNNVMQFFAEQNAKGLGYYEIEQK